ncbi:50S ribosomal protein L3 [Halanaerobacter jeridensis]|uniref:Large ribosomal subunit protein uL3 n=1 Tax=Halanaerobacter jeridensis TaxID=706427 RepID=A0A938XQ91_9FIRM|nr:50S ribosomal protein L3 [Halanaerobacter jeridensis]MBM7557833.1 large subunit ribosomal protein L3 [Halanaerobacter jeridensis]
MKGILGKKIGMTQVFKENGEVVPVTVVKAGPCPVIQKKTEAVDGYEAVQLGFEDAKEFRVNKPEKGHFEKHGISPKKYVKEFRMSGTEELETGDEVTVENFAEGEKVDVTGTSKGKGFAGTVKRWNFNTGPKTHGSRNYRLPGSIGQSADPARVFKGKKMPGRMGRERVTVQNLEVVRIDSEKNVLLIKGGLPGPKKGLLEITETVK